MAQRALPMQPISREQQTRWRGRTQTEAFGFMEIPMLTGIAASFVLVEKMAIHLQDPFENKPTDTPVTAIAQTIERNLRQMLSENEFPQQTQEKNFYVL